MFDVDESHAPGHVTTPSSYKEESGAGEDATIHCSKGGASNKEGDDPAHHSEHLVTEGDSHSIGGENLC